MLMMAYRHALRSAECVGLESSQFDFARTQWTGGRWQSEIYREAGDMVRGSIGVANGLHNITLKTTAVLAGAVGAEASVRPAEGVSADGEAFRR